MGVAREMLRCFSAFASSSVLSNSGPGGDREPPVLPDAASTAAADRLIGALFARDIASLGLWW
jgi:hypothetical protein